MVTAAPSRGAPVGCCFIEGCSVERLRRGVTVGDVGGSELDVGKASSAVLLHRVGVRTIGKGGRPTGSALSGCSGGSTITLEEDRRLASSTETTNLFVIDVPSPCWDLVDVKWPRVRRSLGLIIGEVHQDDGVRGRRSTSLGRTSGRWFCNNPLKLGSNFF